MTLPRNLGQSTGALSPDTDHCAEIKRILAMLDDHKVTSAQIKDSVGQRAAEFIDDMRAEAKKFNRFIVTGKQVFWARDIRDVLIEKGLL